MTYSNRKKVNKNKQNTVKQNIQSSLRSLPEACKKEGTAHCSNGPIY